jgi:Flp pilus assembly protein TadG
VLTVRPPPNGGNEDLASIVSRMDLRAGYGVMADKNTTNSGSFRSDNRGNIAIITALVATILFGVTGAAVDVGRWESLKSETSSALDAAVLAAGRALQIDGTSPDDAIRVAEQYYSLNGPSELPLDKVKFEFADNNSAIVATTDWTLPTTFMNLVGVSGLEVNLRSKAILNTRQPPGVNVEISMMLDTTGSMGWQGRMDELKLAATDLINIVLKDQRGTTKHGIRLAVAPFSSYVNVGRQFYETFTGEAPCWHWGQPHLRPGAGKRKPAVLARTSKQ